MNKLITIACTMAVNLVPIVNATADAIENSENIAVCASCHGVKGVSINSETPNLAGQKKQYLVKQLNDFKSRIRTNPTMEAMASALTSIEIQSLASYYSKMPKISDNLGKTDASRPNIKNAKKNPLSQDVASKTEFPQKIFISMKKSATIQVFPIAETWKGGENMLFTAITPNGEMLLSTSPSTNSVYLFDSETGAQLAIVKVGKAPKGVKVTPNGKFAYVSNQGSSDISVIDLSSYQVVDTIAVASGPHNVRFTRDGHLAYVTLQGGAGLGVIDVKQRKQIKIIAVPGITGPHNVDLSADENTAYIRDFVHNVAVLDLQSEKVIKIIPVGVGHGGIDVTNDDRYIATAAIGDDYISIIDRKSLVVTKLKVGQGSHGIRASKDSQWLYVTLTKENRVVVIDLETLTIKKQIAVGDFPFWIAIQGNP